MPYQRRSAALAREGEAWTVVHSRRSLILARPEGYSTSLSGTTTTLQADRRHRATSLRWSGTVPQARGVAEH